MKLAALLAVAAWLLFASCLYHDHHVVVAGVLAVVAVMHFVGRWLFGSYLETPSKPPTEYFLDPSEPPTPLPPASLKTPAAKGWSGRPINRIDFHRAERHTSIHQFQARGRQ